MDENSSVELVPTGIQGLDDILRGGLTAGKVHLFSGSPGTGKSTFSLHFIAEGIRRGERCLYIAVGSSEKEFLAMAKVGGIALDPDYFSIHRVDISGEILAGPEQRIFHPEETHPTDAMKDMLAEVVRVKPKRLVIDSLSDLRLLSEDLIIFRRLVLALRLEFDKEECTVLITNNAIRQSEVDVHLETMCHGVIYLEQLVLGYGPVRRRLLVSKIRGRGYRSGWHDFRIETGRIRVYPTLIASEHLQQAQRGVVPSGNATLDLILGGGLDRGSAVAITGASGTGKTTMANQIVVAAAKRGEYAVVYLFDETVESFRERAQGVGMAVDEYIDQGLIALNQVDVAEFSVGEFTARIREEVEERDARTVVIDTLIGYANAMREEEYLTLQLHDLLTYLSHHGVTTLITVEQQGIFGNIVPETKNVSYLADSSLLLRFFEYRGEIRRAISVVKRRRGEHETTIRELIISGEGIVIGEPLVEMQGVLTGVPVLEN